MSALNHCSTYIEVYSYNCCVNAFLPPLSSTEQSVKTPKYNFRRAPMPPLLCTLGTRKVEWHATGMHACVCVSTAANAVRGWGNSNASWPPSLYCLPVRNVDTLITCRPCSWFGPRQGERQADKTVVDAESRVLGSFSASVTKWRNARWHPGQGLHVTCQATLISPSFGLAHDLDTFSVS